MSAVPHLLCSSDPKARVLNVFRVYFHQLHSGCGDSDCQNLYCGSSAECKVEGRESKQECMTFVQRHLLPHAFEGVWHACAAAWQPVAAAKLDTLNAKQARHLAESGGIDSAIAAALRVEPHEDGGYPTASWLFLDIDAVRAGSASMGAAAEPAAEWFEPEAEEGGADWVLGTDGAAVHLLGADSHPHHLFGQQPVGTALAGGRCVEVLSRTSDTATIRHGSIVGRVRRSDLREHSKLRAEATLPPLGLDMADVRSLWDRVAGSRECGAAVEAAADALRRYSTSQVWLDQLRREARGLGTIDRSPSERKQLLNTSFTWRLVRLFAVLFACKFALQSQTALVSLATAFTSLSAFVASRVARVWSKCPRQHLIDILIELQGIITRDIDIRRSFSESTLCATEVIGAVFEANCMRGDGDRVPQMLFYNQAANNPTFPVALDYREWARHRNSGMELQRRPPPPLSAVKAALAAVRRERPYAPTAAAAISPPLALLRAPYIVGANFKLTALRVDAERSHRSEMQSSVMQMGLFGQVRDEDVFMVLHIDRADVMGSTYTELLRHSEQLRREIRVKFVNDGVVEEGVDEGGVRKEFFGLLCKDLFNPEYGMFSYDPETRLQWFQPRIRCSTDDMNFHVCGMMFGLAIRHQVLLDVSFPMAVYKKLLDIEPDLSDLEQMHPAVAKSFHELLEWDEEAAGATVEETFCRNFAFTHDVFGEMVEEEFAPGGRTTALTHKNRKEYVEAYTRYVCRTSIGRNFDEFYNGFYRALGHQHHIIAMFTPEELELIVVGSPDLDLHDLESTTSYEGYSATHELVRGFWQLLHAFSPEQQRRFLKFVTGSARVPVGGLSTLRLVIGKNGDDSDQLPTAHTCFNHLLIPEYSSKEKLKEKLLTAMMNCEGFGLM